MKICEKARIDDKTERKIIRTKYQIIWLSKCEIKVLNIVINKWNCENYFIKLKDDWNWENDEIIGNSVRFLSYSLTLTADIQSWFKESA
jgi:hypothetical protein